MAVNVIKAVARLFYLSSNFNAHHITATNGTMLTKRILSMRFVIIGWAVG